MGDAIRILHVGDIHIRDGEHLADTVRCLDFVADLADREKVDLVLIPGDVFDRASTPRERGAFARFVSTVAAPDRQAVICRGNHDRPEELAPFALHPHVTVTEASEIVRCERLGLDVIAVSWPERAYLAARGLVGEGGLQAAQQALGQMLRLMAAQCDRPFVVMGHLSVAGAVASSGQPLVGREIQAVLGDLEDLGASFVALNHIHRHQALAENIVYAGSLTRHDFGEEDEPKGVVLVELDREAGEASWEFVEVPARRWLTVEAGVEADGIVCEWIGGEEVQTIPEDLIRDANVRYRYRCTEAEAHIFDHTQIERRFAEAHTLKIVPGIQREERVRSAAVAEAQTVADKLRAWGEATGTEITPSLLAKLEALEEEVRHA